MMKKKADLFNDTETAKQIMETSNPGKIKSLGRFFFFFFFYFVDILRTYFEYQIFHESSFFFEKKNLDKSPILMMIYGQRNVVTLFIMHSF